MSGVGFVEPVAPDRVAPRLAAWLRERPRPGIAVRVGVDGPDCADPLGLAGAVAAELTAAGRAAVVVAATSFWRDASLRLEFGHQDPDAYLDWLDAGALRREVLDPLGPGGSAQYLPSLRDPVTNRSTREPPRTAAPGTVVLVAGALLFGLGLPFDATVHLAVAAAARTRRTAPAQQWTLPALERYDAEVDPVALADVVVRWNDPQHPALSFTR